MEGVPKNNEGWDAKNLEAARLREEAPEAAAAKIAEHLPADFETMDPHARIEARRVAAEAALAEVNAQSEDNSLRFVARELADIMLQQEGAAAMLKEFEAVTARGGDAAEDVKGAVAA